MTGLAQAGSLAKGKDRMDCLTQVGSAGTGKGKGSMDCLVRGAWPVTGETGAGTLLTLEL